MNLQICVDGRLGMALGPEPGVIAVTRRSILAGRWRRWRPLDPDRIIGELASCGGDVLVLVPPCDADAGADVLARVARALAFPVLRLPGEHRAAVAVAATAVEVAQCGGDAVAVRRAVEVICGCATATADPMNGERRRIRPGVLVRWAARAWTACTWCAAGATAGAACPRCGRPIGAGR